MSDTSSNTEEKAVQAGAAAAVMAEAASAATSTNAAASANTSNSASISTVTPADIAPNINPATGAPISAPSPAKVQAMARRLSNDSKKSGFFTFEASWGHRMLLGVSIALIVLAIILVIYCVMRLVSVMSQPQDYFVTEQFSKFVYFYYGCGTVAGLALIPPAIIGIAVAKSGKHTILACIAPAIAAFLALALLGARLAWGSADIWASIWQAAVMLILPIAYFIPALKVHTFTKSQLQSI